MTVAVYITSYNQKDYLREAIGSVLAQTRLPDQIIVVDDASTDGSQELIKDYKKKHSQLFDVVFHKENIGVAQTRIDALKRVTCDYVTYLDGDDVFKPGKIESEYKLITSSAADIVFSNYENRNKDLSHCHFIWKDKKDSMPKGNVYKEVILREFPKKTLFKMEMVRYDAWKKIGFHDLRLKIYEDYEMRIRLTEKLDVVYNDEVLSSVRLHKNGLSGSSSKEYIESLQLIRNSVLKTYNYKRATYSITKIKKSLNRHISHYYFVLFKKNFKTEIFFYCFCLWSTVF